MAVLKNLTNKCLDALYVNCETIINHYAHKDREKQRQHAAHRYVIEVTHIVDLWNLPCSIDQYRDDHVQWKIRIQDLDKKNFSTLTLCLQSAAEFKRFKAFLRHLIFNWFRDIDVEKLHNGYLSFMITRPFLVRLDIFPYDHTRHWNEDFTLAGTKSARVKTVSKIVSRLVKDFCLYTADKTTNIAASTKASKHKQLEKFKNHDQNVSFRENKVFNTDRCYYKNTSLDVLLQQLKQAYTSLSIDSPSSLPRFRKQLRSDGMRAQISDVQHLKVENARLKKSTEALTREIENLQLKIRELAEEVGKMAAIGAKKEEELQEAFVELGRLSVESTMMRKEKKRNERFNKTFNSHSASTQTPEVSEWPIAPSVSRMSHDRSSSSGMNGTQAEVERRHGQESVEERVSFSDLPQTGVYGNIYNNYKLLFLRISHGLLKDDVINLQRWAETEFGINSLGNVDAIFLELDRREIISVIDLSRLRKYFEDNGRYDFVHLIDNFLLGEYSHLKNPNLTGTLRPYNQRLSAQNGSRFSHLYSSQSTTGRLTRISQGPGDWSKRNSYVPRLRESQNGSSEGGSGSSQNARRNGTDLDLRRSPYPGSIHRPTTSSSCGQEVTRNISTSYGVQVVTGSVRAEQVQANGYQGDTSRNTDQGRNGVNGQKLSKVESRHSSENASIQNGGSGLDDDDSQWLCSHYKRRCHVQFECCDKFWPCHRCHNNQSSCGRRKLKSRDTKQIKCVACGHEQPFAHYCSRCNAKFAQYFCGLCKHLTGNDDNPYHCEKCGICRIHGDRSFHCDVCGVCLDVQLLGNHKCREGSAHDECCICLEDAFTGCQILPCSHKVHKECATQMIRSGITRCPICRESFAHKLEKKSYPSKKPLRKQ